jgi:hypothetical protein
MASRVQKRRGSKADHNSFTTGAAGEVTVEMPANRNFTATDGTREYGAIHLHYGDGQIGDRIPVGEELNNQVRTVVDEQKFLARITHFKPLNPDYSTTTPNALPNRFLYAWEEVSLGSTFYDVAQIWTLTIETNAAGSAGDHTIKIPNSSGAFQTVTTADIANNETPENAAIKIYDDLHDLDDTADGGSLKLCVSETSESGVYRIERSGAVLTFTALGDYKGHRPVPQFSTTDASQTGTVAITTEGQSNVPQINISNADLARKSDAATGGTHLDAAINVHELMNDKDFVFPGIRTSPGQDANGDWPTNARVIPIGGVASYVSGSGNNQAETESESGTAYESSSSETSNTNLGFTSNAEGWRLVDEQVVIEMTERRKLVVGTATGTTAGRTGTDGISRLYYFSATNALVGPC